MKLGLKHLKSILTNIGFTQRLRRGRARLFVFLVLSLPLYPAVADNSEDLQLQEAAQLIDLFRAIFGKTTEVPDDYDKGASSASTSSPAPTLAEERENGPSEPLPISPPDPSITPLSPSIETAPVVQALAPIQAQSSPNPTLDAYRARYEELRSKWGIGDQSSLSFEKRDNVFFKTFKIDDSTLSAVERRSGNLTSEAVLALQLRFLIENPNIVIQGDNLQNLRVIEATATSDTARSVNFGMNDLQEAWVRPVLDRFHRQGTREVFSAIIRVSTGTREHFVTVVANKDGRVDLIDPESGEKTYNPYILKTLIDYLNVAQTGNDKITFREGDAPVYTGIQANGSFLQSSSIYAFTYWAASLYAESIDAYMAVNGAYADAHLTDFGQTPSASVYSKKIKKVTGLQNENRYDEQLRHWLQNEAHALNH